MSVVAGGHDKKWCREIALEDEVGILDWTNALKSLFNQIFNNDSLIYPNYTKHCTIIEIFIIMIENIILVLIL